MSSPKTSQILSFYKALLKTRSFAITVLKHFILQNPEVTFFQSMLDFFTHVLPFIFTYKSVLKQNNFTVLSIFQPKLWILLTFSGCLNYSKAVLFQNFLFKYWNDTNHLLSSLLHTFSNFFNEEIGEISLSTAARSVKNSGESIKSDKLMENFPFVSKIRQAANFFGVALPFKHDFVKETNTVEENPSAVVLKAKLVIYLNKILASNIKLKGINFIIL